MTTALIVWLLLFVADRPRAVGFETAEMCQAAIEQLSKQADVIAMSECVRIEVRPVAPSQKAP